MSPTTTTLAKAHQITKDVSGAIAGNVSASNLLNPHSIPDVLAELKMLFADDLDFHETADFEKVLQRYADETSFEDQFCTLSVEEYVWGNYIYKDTTPSLSTLEFLHTYAGRYADWLLHQGSHDTIGINHTDSFATQGSTGATPNILAALETPFDPINGYELDSDHKHFNLKKISALNLYNPALRFMLYLNVLELSQFSLNSKVSDETLWNNWKAAFNAQNNGILRNKTFEFIKEAYLGDFAKFVDHIKFLQANSFEIDSNKRFSSKFLFPFNIYAVYSDAKPGSDKSKPLVSDSRFFRGVGHIIFGMLLRCFNCPVEKLTYEQLQSLATSSSPFDIGFFDVGTFDYLVTGETNVTADSAHKAQSTALSKLLEPAQRQMARLKRELCTRINQQILQVATYYPNETATSDNQADDKTPTLSTQKQFNADTINQVVRILSVNDEMLDPSTVKNFNTGDAFLRTYLKQTTKGSDRLSFLPCQFDWMFYQMAYDLNFVLSLSIPRFDQFDILMCITHLYLLRYTAQRASSVYLATQQVKRRFKQLQVSAYPQSKTEDQAKSQAQIKTKASANTQAKNPAKAQTKILASSANLASNLQWSAPPLKPLPYTYFLIESNTNTESSQIRNCSKSLYKDVFAKMLSNESEHYITYRIYRSVLEILDAQKLSAPDLALKLKHYEQGPLTRDEVVEIVRKLVTDKPLKKPEDAHYLLALVFDRVTQGKGNLKHGTDAAQVKPESIPKNLDELCSRLIARVHQRKRDDYTALKNIASEIGLLSRDGTNAFRFILSDKLLKSLVIVILHGASSMRDKEFFEQLYQRFGIIVRDQEFKDMKSKTVCQLSCDDKQLKINATALCNRLKILNLCNTLQDSSISYIKNPYH